LLVITSFLEIIRLEAIIYFYLISNFIISIVIIFFIRRIICRTEIQLKN
jgi:hypothetical protein